MEQDQEKLGRAVLARRQELRLTQDEVYSRGGPSDTKLTEIENGQGPTPRPSTLRKLDEALEWSPGSAANILAGGQASPANQPGARDRTQDATDEQESDRESERDLGLDASSEDYLADVERGVDIALESLRLKLAGRMEEAEDLRQLADQFASWWSHRNAPSVRALDQVYDRRLRRAQKQFSSIRTAISELDIWIERATTGLALPTWEEQIQARVQMITNVLVSPPAGDESALPEELRDLVRKAMLTQLGPDHESHSQDMDPALQHDRAQQLDSEIREVYDYVTRPGNEGLADRLTSLLPEWNRHLRAQERINFAEQKLQSMGISRTEMEKMIRTEPLRKGTDY